MSVKKKLSLGVASAALGLALIGGGTWAAFNDVETLNNSFAAGTLDLDVVSVDGGATTFELQNLKPGDTMERCFKLENKGTLAIKEVLMETSYSGFKNGKNEFVTKHGQHDNNAYEFLDQFHVQILITGIENLNAQPREGFELIKPEDNVTLKDLVKGERLNLAPYNEDEQWTGLPIIPEDHEIVCMTIAMKDDKTKVKHGKAKGEYVQNKYQGDSIKVHFTLEATQWDGLTPEQTKDNGYLEINKRSNSN